MFVAANAGPSLKVAADSQSSTPSDLLKHWSNEYLGHKALLPGYGFIIFFVAFMGAVSMAGVLNYPRNHPINVFIPLALFAFLPLVLTVTSAYMTLKPVKYGGAGHPLISLFIKRFNLTSYLPYQSILMRWLVWQFQSLSVAFICGALVSFFLLATFQDYQFGWSSTLIRDNAMMAEAVSIMSWPWHWWVAIPGVEAINNSRFHIGGSTRSDHNFWWQIMVLAMLVYGLLPRLLLMLVLRWRFIDALKRNISQSSDLELFFVAQQHKESRNALLDEVSDAQMAVIPLTDIKAPLVGWHTMPSSIELIKQLGNDSWQQDEQWLTSFEAQQLTNIHVLVNAMSAPTGELADCIRLLPKPVTLILCFDSKQHSRVEAQKISWQYFAQQHCIETKIGT